ncbi:MAG: hypothetical protein NVS3B26_26960 [Mycobacteriales bacterium]
MNRLADAAARDHAAVRIARCQQEGPASHPSLRRLSGSLMCAGLVLLAVGLELASAQAANTPESSRYADVVPLGWPRPVRVLWWVLIAAAAAGHRLLLDERRNAGRYVIAALAATPFALFALGIAVGAPWATWH